MHSNGNSFAGSPESSERECALYRRLLAAIEDRP
jgi:hypothetical protein